MSKYRYKDLIKRLQNAENDLNDATVRKSKAECELANAINVLGNWLLPNAEVGEKFSVLHGDSLITLTCKSKMSYKISFMKYAIPIVDYAISVKKDYDKSKWEQLA